jgi:branched-chain amino acid transport system substrate-binding protein
MVKLVAMLTLMAMLLLHAPIWAEIPPPPIKLGMSAALSGPAQSLGTDMKIGIESYLARVNEEGGISGRQLELIAMDDGYVPEEAIRNMNALIDKEKVIAIVGNVGTPTAQVTVPIGTEKKTLMFGFFTGAGLLRTTPPNRYVLNYRASYVQETAAMVQGLLDQGILPYEIAIFAQNDAYGDAGYAGVIQGLEAAGNLQGLRLVQGRYERNTLEVETALLKIIEAPIKPRAIIMIGTYEPCAKFIRLARRVLPDATYLNVSFVGSQALMNALGPDSEGLVITQVVPHFDSDLPLTREYLRDLEAYAPKADPGFVSLEGYVVARIFVEGLRRAGPDVDRETIIESLLSIENVDIGLGTPVGFTRENHQASHIVWPTVIRNGRFEPFAFELPEKGVAP